MLYGRKLTAKPHALVSHARAPCCYLAAPLVLLLLLQGVRACAG